MSQVRYKYCIVPHCQNTTSKTPNKVFISMPRNLADRRKWCTVMKRDQRKNVVLSTTSDRHVCEDHFDMENDFENYTRHKLQGVKLLIKRGILPHRFECQRAIQIPESRARAEKREHRQLVSHLLNNTEDDASTSAMEVPQDEDEMDMDFPATAYTDKGTQANLMVPIRSKAVGTVMTTTDSGCDPMPSDVLDKACGTSPRLMSPATHIEMFTDDRSDNEFVHIAENDSDYVASDENDSDYIFEQDDSHFKLQMQSYMISAIEKETMMCLGIPPDVKYLITFLSEKAKCSTVNIMITLKKIRMNLSNAYLAMLFGKSESQVSRIFLRTLYRLSSILKNFIFFPKNSLDVQKCLPISFRARFRNVLCLIDCFEISIEKPSNPIHQALTWSEYKKANTIKYLIGCTPDGTVCFLSKGYGGRASDSTLVEDSDFMSHLINGMDIMADRGFKNIAHLLEQKNCKLIRPPSVSQDIPMTREECLLTKQTSALRIHVERVIGRLREFNILQPHVCLDIHLIQILDYILNVVAGIINLQSTIIRY